MITELLTPIDKTIFEKVNFEKPFSLASTITFFEGNLNVLEEETVVLIGIEESRGSTQEDFSEVGFNEIREQFYLLFKGNWSKKIVDLGNVKKGNNLSDTYFAVKKIISYLIEKKCIPVVLGGSQNITYAIYRAYDQLQKTTNICSVDRKFDLGLFSEEKNADSYLNQILTEEPRKLFNFYGIGHQSYYVSQEEMDLITQMNFEYLRLGSASKNISETEPFLRDSDLVSIDMSAIRYSESPANSYAIPNGLDGKEICAITRYAGMSSKVSCLSVFEYNPIKDIRNQTAILIAQMIWYFIEGYNLREEMPNFSKKDAYLFYTVPVEDREFKFVKNIKLDHWWIELDYESKENNVFEKRMIPCSYNDYLKTIEGEIPDRWWKNYKKYL
ncbi:formimidoylglutamase [Flavobacteriaceae bacterium UJ101]|nr:formimidoylglutamase [Flavobacteriaceae bacterium UJ101]